MTVRRLAPVLVILAACAGPPAEAPSAATPAATPVSKATPDPGEAATDDSSAAVDPPTATSAIRGDAVRVLFAGDVMLGRGVADLDPTMLFEGVRFVLAAADLSAANLESPLTARPHDPDAGPNALEAPPGAAALLRSAGFDAMAVANNHAADAGPATATGTVAALGAVGLVAVGAGATPTEALAARVVELGDLRVALLAIDATGTRPAGVATWDPALVRRAVREARADADLVAVGLHGGAEHVPGLDPGQWARARRLASWGADVVWGHGAHVVQPVRAIDPDGDGRPTVVATSLGNLVFDQHVPGSRRGALLEVLAGPEGVRAFRVGRTEHRLGPPAFRGWRPPRGDAVALDGWWTLARAPMPSRSTTLATAPGPVARRADLGAFEGEVVAAAVGDANADGERELVLAFRRPFRPTEVNALLPRRALVDALGRTAHVGLYEPGDLSPLWVAGTLFRPVGALAACEGSLAVAHTTLDRDAVVATGAWRWSGFGFVPFPELSGPGSPACADVDGDGALDPLVLGRSPR